MRIILNLLISSIILIISLLASVNEALVGQGHPNPMTREISSEALADLETNKTTIGLARNLFTPFTSADTFVFTVGQPRPKTSQE